MELDIRTLRSLYAIEKQNHGDTVFGTLQLQFTEYNNYKRQYKKRGRNTLARTTLRGIKTDSTCKQMSIGHREKIRH